MKINSLVYGLFGTIAIGYGTTVLLAPAMVVSDAGQSFHLAHNLREQGAAGIFIGLMSFWCIFNYERRRSVHYCLMVFAFLLAAIHWLDYLAGHLPWMSPLYNSVPFLVLLVIAVLSRSRENT